MGNDVPGKCAPFSCLQTPVAQTGCPRRFFEERGIHEILVPGGLPLRFFFFIRLKFQLLTVFFKKNSIYYYYCGKIGFVAAI